MVNICVDGFNLAMPNGTGIATYGHSLLENLCAIGAHGQVLYGPHLPPQSTPNLDEISVISNAPPAKQHKVVRYFHTLSAQFGVQARHASFSPSILWPEDGPRRPAAQSFWVANGLFNRANRLFNRHGKFTPVTFGVDRNAEVAPDIVHWTCPIPLYAKKALNVLTIHDVIPLKLPHSTQDQKTQYYRKIAKSCQHADAIFTVSEHTKSDLLDFLDIDESKIFTTYQSYVPSTQTANQHEDQEWLERNLGLRSNGYFLFYGAIEPKKNLGRIVEAYLNSKTDTPLVIVSGRSWLSEHETGLLDATQALGRAPIIRLDYMPKAVLDRLISNAKAVLFPSLYEGFGLPALEAMARTIPVLGANGHSLAEIIGDGGLLVDPYSVPQIASAIRALDNDQDLRTHLSQKGLERSLNFTPTKYQQRLRAAYRSLGVSL